VVINPGGVPPIGRQAAQRLAREELSKGMYHRHSSLLTIIFQRLQRWLHTLFRHANATVPGGWWGLIAITALVVIVIAVALTWMGPVRRTRRASRQSTRTGRARTAREYRESAKALAAAGDYAAAICECVRAIAAELDERGILLPRVGRTADEFASEAGLALPGHADGLRAAALLFDEVRYGRRAGSQPGYERVRDLDVEVRASAGRVSKAAGPAPAAVSAGRAP
jgi:uncharacterized membrane protein